MHEKKHNLPTIQNGDLLGEVFGRYARDFFSPYFDSEERGFTPKIELEETDKGYLVSAELPGMKEKDITVTLQDNCLILEGMKETKSEENKKGYYRSEFNYGSFYRSIPFRADVDDSKVEATYKNGILTVDLVKKADGTEKTHRIPINKH